MNLDWLRADIASARRASIFLVLLLAGSMLANVTLAVFAIRMADRERVVVVPPSRAVTASRRRAAASRVGASRRQPSAVASPRSTRWATTSTE